MRSKINILLYVLLTILLSSFVFASLTDDLKVYYGFNVGSNYTNLADESQFNATRIGGGVVQTVAKHGSGSLNTGGKTSGINSNYGASELYYRDAITINFWINGTTTEFFHNPGDENFGLFGLAVGLHNYMLYLQTNESISVLHRNAGGDSSGLVGSLDLSTDVVDGIWHMMTWRISGNNVEYFRDGILKVNASISAVGNTSLVYDLYFGCRNAGPGCTAGTNVDMDELGIWGRSLALTEISTLYNGDAGSFYPFTTSKVISSQIDLLFQNSTGSYTNTFLEGEDFSSFVNYTSTNQTAINLSQNSTCNITSYNTLVEEKATDQNFSVCSAGCDYSTYSENLTGLETGGIQDYVYFKACHNGISTGNIDVSLSCDSGSYSDTILLSEYPLCSVGNARVSINNSVCGSDDWVLINVSSVVNSARSKQIQNLALDREFTSHTNNVVFNGSLGLFQINHEHEYYIHGSKKVEANCSYRLNSTYDNSTTENITIENVAPVVTFSDVNTSFGFTTLTDNMQIEYVSGVWNWFGSVQDDDLDTLNVTWYNSSGYALLSFQGDPTTTVLNTNATSLFIDFDGNPFSINVTVNDTEGLQTNASLVFIVNDTLNPSCNFGSNYEYLPNVTEVLNITCTDNNFFSLNITCPVNNQSYYVSGLNVQSYNTIFNITNPQSETCSYRYADGHTAYKLNKDFDALTYESKIEVLANAESVAVLNTTTPGAVVTYEILRDRLSYEFDFSRSSEKKHVFNLVTHPDAVYLKDNKYSAWIVSDSLGIWFDMNSENVQEKAKVKKIRPGVFEITIKTKEKKLKFESIGELNVQTGSFTLTNAFGNNLFIAPTNSCPLDGDLADVIGVFVLFGIFGMMIIINAMFLKVGVVDLLIGIGFIFLGSWLWSCSYLIANLIIAFGLIYGVYMGFRNPSSIY